MDFCPINEGIFYCVRQGRCFTFFNCLGTNVFQFAYFLVYAQAVISAWNTIVIVPNKIKLYFCLLLRGTCSCTYGCLQVLQICHYVGPFVFMVSHTLLSERCIHDLRRSSWTLSSFTLACPLLALCHQRKPRRTPKRTYNSGVNHWMCYSSLTYYSRFPNLSAK